MQMRSGRLADRAQRIEEFDHMTARDEVLHLLISYCRAVDDRETDKLWRLFDVDCEFIFVDDAIAHGVGEIRENLGGRIAGAIRHRHILTNSIVEIDGDTATAKSDWYLIKPAAGQAWEIEGAGYYDDQMRRSPSGWLFTRRQIRPAPR
jgi:3-phenylpropionate/cinnamic acid dioxygenase small subunit